jgi:hypothetical protein
VELLSFAFISLIKLVLLLTGYGSWLGEKVLYLPIEVCFDMSLLRLFSDHDL